MAEKNTLLDWAASGGHVDKEVLVGNQDYVSGESVVLAAGPPTIEKADSWNLFPIGVVQNVGISQSRQLSQLFELGSAESYFIPGKTFVNANLSRVLVHGPSLLKAVYKYSGTDAERPDLESLKGNPPTAPYSESYDGETENQQLDGLMYMNLSSSFFNRPIGLLMLMQDAQKEDYAAIYLENCHIQSHQITMSAQQTLIMENLALRCSKVSHLDVGSGTPGPT
jgi:hypothetical protein